MSMKGLTVRRTTRSPNRVRRRALRLGSAEEASVSSVDMPRSQCWQMVCQTRPMSGCDSEDCSESSPSRDSRTERQSPASSRSR
ncbi:Uncharacterised protein [Mycobacteroides abscessus subsp. abscessus]|nr:Uncharacterised protein [Mycobacteroides abscessus subsp. abscessus]